MSALAMRGVAAAFRAGAATAALISTTGCIKVNPGYVEEDKASTVKAIEQLHQRYNAGAYSEIYGNAHDVYQRSQKSENTLAAMRRAREEFGTFQRVDTFKMNVVVGAPVQIRAVYNSTFEKGPTTELFTFLKEESGVRLAHYQIYPGTIEPKAP